MATASSLRGIPVVILLFALLTAGCAAPRTSLIARGGIFQVDGGIGASQGPVSGVSTADDLGLESVFAFQPRIDVDWDDWHLSASGFDVESSGTGAADARFEWNGRVIESGVATESTLGLRLITTDVAWDPIPWEFMDIGIGVGLGYLWYDAYVLAEEVPVGIGIDQSTPMGYLLLRLAKQMPDWGVILRLAGVSASWENDEITYYEADLMGSIRLWGDAESVRGDLILGYRYLYAEYIYSSSYSFETDPTLQGPYIGFAVVF
ncbi:MAG: hypothetical protein ABFS86_15770 [Planctomycetota bacterium]